MSTTRLLFTTGDVPVGTVKRKIGATNVGLYCSNCAEFFAFAVLPDGSTPLIELTADEPIRVQCPFCQHQEHRPISEVRSFRLTEGAKQRGPLPASPGSR